MALKPPSRSLCVGVSQKSIRVFPVEHVTRTSFHFHPPSEFSDCKLPTDRNLEDDRQLYLITYMNICMFWLIGNKTHQCKAPKECLYRRVTLKVDIKKKQLSVDNSSSPTQQPPHTTSVNVSHNSDYNPNV